MLSCGGAKEASKFSPQISTQNNEAASSDTKEPLTFVRFDFDTPIVVMQEGDKPLPDGVIVEQANSNQRVSLTNFEGRPCIGFSYNYMGGVEEGTTFIKTNFEAVVKCLNGATWTALPQPIKKAELTSQLWHVQLAADGPNLYLAYHSRITEAPQPGFPLTDMGVIGIQVFDGKEWKEIGLLHVKGGFNASVTSPISMAVVNHKVYIAYHDRINPPQIFRLENGNGVPLKQLEAAIITTTTAPQFFSNLHHAKLFSYKDQLYVFYVTIKDESAVGGGKIQVPVGRLYNELKDEWSTVWMKNEWSPVWGGLTGFCENNSTSNLCIRPQGAEGYIALIGDIFNLFTDQVNRESSNQALANIPDSDFYFFGNDFQDFQFDPEKRPPYPRGTMIKCHVERDGASFFGDNCNVIEVAFKGTALGILNPIPSGNTFYRVRRESVNTIMIGDALFFVFEEIYKKDGKHFSFLKAVKFIIKPAKITGPEDPSRPTSEDPSESLFRRN